MRNPVLLGLSLLLVIPSVRGQAQQISPVAPVAYRAAAGTPLSGEQEPTKPVRMAGGIAGGIAGGATGLLLGMYGGVAIAEGGNCRGEECGLLGAILGLTVGESLGMAVGTHFGSRGHGNLALAALTSTAIGVAGLYACAGAEGAAPVILSAVPVIQLAVLLAMER